MIYVTGDIHGNPVRFNTSSFPEQKEMTKDDYVIILGDFGLIWDKDEEGTNEKYWLKWLEDKSFTTVFVDGNHENHKRLSTYPIKEWNGGLVHEIRPSVFHLMRGEVFTLQKKKFFAFGGAQSHDIYDGILEYDGWRKQAKVLESQGKYMYRIRDLSWWEEEMPNEEEKQNGRNNLEKNDWKVDFILSHDCPSSTQAQIYIGNRDTNELNVYLEEIKQKCEYTRWLFGHNHINKQVNEKDIALYEQIVRIL